MKLKKTSEDLIKKIVALESEVMIPTLSWVGIHLTSSDLYNELVKDRDQIIIPILHSGELRACLRMNLEGEDLYIKSLCLSPKASRLVLKRLFTEASHLLKDFPIKRITSVVQKSNIASIHFHEKLGFYREKENDKAIGFFIPATKLKKEVVPRFCNSRSTF